MDDLNKFKLKKRRRAGGSVDGFLSKKKSKSPEIEPASSKIGDFKRSEGFHPYSQAKINSPAKAESSLGTAALDIDEIVIDNYKPIKKGRRRFWLFGKRKLAKEKKPMTLRKKITLASCGTIALLLLIGAGYAYFKFHGILKGGGGAPALNANVDPNLLRGEGDGRVNVLIMGKGGPGHDGPDLTDTLLLASIDTVNNKAALLSVPRDLYVLNNGYHTKINAVYANAKDAVLNGPRIPNQKEMAEKAGFKAIKEEIQTVLGIPIHYQVMVDFSAFKQAIDAVGGVTINVKQELYDPSIAWENNWDPVIAPVGVQTMNGKKALLYAKSRHGSARGDFDRTERQRQILEALKDKVLKLGTFSNPITLTRLINAFGNHVRTDFTQSELLRVYNIGKGISSNNIKSIGLADPPNNYVTTSTIGGLSVVVPTAGLDNYDAIRNYIRNTLRDGFLAKENARVVVLNGTNVAGLAKKVGDKLKSFGYRVTKEADATQKNFSTNTLVDLTGGVDKYTKHYLEKRFGLTATSDLPNGVTGYNKDNADFVIIVGQNEVTTPH